MLAVHSVGMFLISFAAAYAGDLHGISGKLKVGQPCFNVPNIYYLNISCDLSPSEFGKRVKQGIVDHFDEIDCISSYARLVANCA